ncbi:MAG: MATE family efflux transporter, partial [Alistipes sp.]|nr:MATE family efflux transporter [Alistipes sp.]
GFQMVATNFFQSLGMASKAIFLSLSRQLLFLMPALLLLPYLFDEMGLEASWGVWCALPASDLLAAVVTALLLVSQLRKFGQKIA